MTTKQEYMEWAKSEPLSDVCVDMENVYTASDHPDYWAHLLEAGKISVEGRKREQLGSGTKVSMTFTVSTGETVIFSATVIRHNDDGTVTVRIPERVRRTKWSPFTAAAYRVPVARALLAKQGQS
jgi:hypothetical protein